MACNKLRKLAIAGVKSCIFFALAIITSPVSSAAEIYAGQISIWPESRVFTPCNSQTAYWVTAEPETLRKLTAEHQSLQPKPYSTTYVVIRGTPGPQLNCGFCQDYPPSLNIEKVIEHRADQIGGCSN